MKSIFLSILPLLLPSSTAAPLKGSQLRHSAVPLRHLKKDAEPELDAIHQAPVSFTAVPTVMPSMVPTGSPSEGPSFRPSASPSLEPSVSLSVNPSVNPSSFSNAPSESVTDIRDTIATLSPTFASTISPVTSTAPPSEAAVVTDSPSHPPVITTTSSTTTAATPNTDYSISIVPLKPFRVDFVSTLRHDDHGGNLRHLTFFESHQDATLVHILSQHVQLHLSELGDVLAVQLKILDKDESAFDKSWNESDLQEDGVDNDESGRELAPDLSLILVSYTIEGEVLLANVISPGIHDKLQEMTIDSFTGDRQQNSLLTTLSASEDTILRSITDVDATSILSFDFANHEIQSTTTDNTSEPTSKVNKLFPTLIGLAFLSTLSAITFLIHRKYNEYKNNEYASYQQRKQRSAYNHFESPESSITENVTPISQNNEHAVVFTYDDVEESSSEDERGWSSTSTSTDVLDWNVPFDEHSLGARQMMYEDSTQKELRMIQMGTEEGVIPAGTVRSVPVAGIDESQSNVTLDGLYSTADSYFDGTAKNRNARCDSIDTLNGGTEAFGPGWEREVKFEGVLEVMEREELVTDVTKILLQNCVTEKACGETSDVETPRDQCVKPQSEHIIKAKDSQDASQNSAAKQSSIKSMYFTSDTAAKSKANISAGIFTQETLGMINRNRLKSTPPPSENDYDEDIVNDAKENALLGQWKMESDSEEESLFEDTGVCVKAASPGYCLDRIG